MALNGLFDLLKGAENAHGKFKMFMDSFKSNRLQVILIIIYVNFIRNIKSECLLNNEFIPDGCHQCLG
jgi:hypothetical protein